MKIYFNSTFQINVDNLRIIFKRRSSKIAKMRYRPALHMIRVSQEQAVNWDNQQGTRHKHSHQSLFLLKVVTHVTLSSSACWLNHILEDFLFFFQSGFSLDVYITLQVLYHCVLWTERTDHNIQHSCNFCYCHFIYITAQCRRQTLLLLRVMSSPALWRHGACTIEKLGLTCNSQWSSNYNVCVLFTACITTKRNFPFYWRRTSWKPPSSEEKENFFLKILDRFSSYLTLCNYQLSWSQVEALCFRRFLYKDNRPWYKTLDIFLGIISRFLVLIKHTSPR